MDDYHSQDQLLPGQSPSAVPVAQAVAPQPVVVTQPVVYQQPAPTTVSAPNQVPVERAEDLPQEPIVLKIYSHSTLFYWWPAWVMGYVVALLTYMQGRQNQIGDDLEWFHPNSSLGVVYFVTLFLVILITNVSARGLVSALVIVSAAFVTVLLAYLRLWDDILAWLGNLRIYLNLGAYVFFSTLLFVTWLLAVFVFDRLTYWRIKPGQITYEFVFGAGSTSYDTDGMTVEKHRDDLFRHWVLGLGSGDLRILTTGASRERIDVPNVLFIGAKVNAIQRMIAIQPEAFGHAAIK